MTAASTAGAASREPVNWHAIDWQRVHQNVRRLQARIVKATQAGRWGKVRALQRLLTRSFSGKALAVKRVTENHGKRTAGVDGETWDTPAKKAQAIQALRQHGYRSRPLKRVYLLKPNGKKRPLGIPCMIDRAMQALYVLALDPIAETTADPNSYGFRPERATVDAIVQCHLVLGKRTSAQWILEGDIRACFDTISHEWLEANIPMERRILQQWLKAGFIDQHVLHATVEGTPQGGPVSPVLMNLTLNGLERDLSQFLQSLKRKDREAAKVHLIRFADDFIATGSSRELLETTIKPRIEAFMGKRGLQLSPEKTCITHIEDGFDFLGHHIRKYKRGSRYHLLSTPSKKNVKTFLTKVRGVIKAQATASAAHLILLLNPIIRGWANYHRHGASSATFIKVDSAIFRALWQWAKRRHPRKAARWIKHKYFGSLGGRNWVFFGEVAKPEQKTQKVWLYLAVRTTIRRHRKIQGAANPYDPAWELYFEERLGVKMAEHLKGRRTLFRLWKAQEGLCPVCNQAITEVTGWHNHHIVWRSHGGSDRVENRVLLHPNCHRQLHSHGLTVVKPRPSPGVGEA
jgi:RNA-directed DNA polymerase